MIEREWNFLKKKTIWRLGVPLMHRFTILNTPWFGIKVHKFVSNDHSCLHDHPWAFITLLLKGGYYEVSDYGKKYYPPGTILFRKATYRHKVQLSKDFIGMDLKGEWVFKDRPSYSLVLTFKPVREWGFWKQGKWFHWKLFNEDDEC